jgi:hypothetical protein
MAVTEPESHNAHNFRILDLFNLFHFVSLSLSAAKDKVMQKLLVEDKMCISCAAACCRTWVETNTLPPMWPHFLVPGFWSCTQRQDLGRNVTGMS